MLTLYENVDALRKCWHFMEMLVFYENDGSLLKCWCHIEMLAPYMTSYWIVGTRYNETCKLQQLAKMTVSLLFGLANSTVNALLCSCWWFSFCPDGVVHSTFCCLVCPWPPSGQLIWADCSHTGPPWLHWPNVGVLLNSKHSFEITDFLRIHISSTRPGIKKP